MRHTHALYGSTVRSAPSLTARTTWWTVLFFTAVIPLAFSRAMQDNFRLLKELMFRAEGILLLGMALYSLAAHGPAEVKAAWRSNRLLWSVVGLAAVWATVCTLTATSPALSADSLITILVSILIFSAAALTFRGGTPMMIYAILVAALINSAAFLIETVRNTNHVVDRRTALLGNRDDVGSYLAIAFIVGISAGVSDRTRKRWITFACSGIIAAALAVSSVTSTAAAVAGAIVVAAFSSRPTRVALAIGIAAVLVASPFVKPLRTRIDSGAAAIRAGDWDALTSNRLIAFRAAAGMFRRHPVTGVGPGCFRREFFPYKLEVERDHRELLSTSTRFSSFAEVHNDHLQILAEAGAVGYALLMLFLFAVARQAWRPRSEDLRARMARILTLPLNAVFVVDAAGHFPLELAAPRTLYLFCAALCVGWTVEQDKPEAIRNGTGSPAIKTIVALLAILMVAALLRVLVYEPYRCNVLIVQAQARALLASEHAESLVAPALARASLEALRDCRTCRYGDIGILMVRAADHRLLRRLPQAEAEYRRALAISPRPELYLNLGLVLLQEGRIDEAHDVLLQAVLFDYQILEEIVDVVEHDRLERLIKGQYPWVFPETRSPTLMIP